MNFRTASYRSSAVSLSSTVSEMIRDGRYEELPTLFAQIVPSNAADQNPLWESHSRGWTPMHVAAIASPTMPLKWWRWLVIQQQSRLRRNPEKSKLWTVKNDQGQTVVDLFFRMALNPLPWCKNSMKRRARRLKGAIERILEEEEEGNLDVHDNLLQKLRQLIATDDEKYYSQEDHSNLRRNIQEDEENANPEEDLQIVLQFWTKLRILFYIPGSKSASSSMVHVLSGLPWCPEIVGRLVVALFPSHVNEMGSSFDTNNDGGDCQASLPLHRCVRSFSATHPRGMLSVLCEAYPSAVEVPIPSCRGRLPLHVALTSGQHTWEACLRNLFEARPSVASQPDPVTGLPVFCLAGDALAPITDNQIQEVAKALGNHSLYWKYMSTREQSMALEEASILLARRKITTMYEILRKDPSVLT